MKRPFRALPAATLFFAAFFFGALSTAILAETPYEKDMQRFEKEVADNPPPADATYFVGSSTFTIWKEIPEDFKEFKAVNRGFGGSQIVDWLNFACDRVLVERKPSRIVFFCGCNDIASGKSEEETLENFKKFVAKMRDVNPKLTIHFCALHMPPVREKNWSDFRKFNADVKELVDQDPQMFYVDFAAATSDEKGAGREELFQKDRLHLTREAEKLLIPLISESIKKEIELSETETSELKPLLFALGTGADSREAGSIPTLDPKAENAISLGSTSIATRAVDGKFVLSLSSSAQGEPFAQTSAELDSIDFVAKRSAPSAAGAPVDQELFLGLKSGWVVVFSKAVDERGFVALDYVAPKNATLKNEEPLVWELLKFDASRIDSLKAFGTAGLKAIDGHKGSYAFLAIVDPATRAGVVGGWITSEKSGGVVRSEKSNEGNPLLIPRLDFGAYENKGRFLSERFVLGAFDDCRIGLENYADAIADHYAIELKTNALNGYCTWYSDKNGGCCDENAIKELTKSIVEKFGDFGFQYVQIDDGWQLGASKNGPNKNFTAHNPNGRYASGMPATSKFLNDNNLIAGVWLMPFSGNSDDPYWADKQDLFVRSAIDYPEPGKKNERRYSNIDQKKGAPYETFWGGTSLDTSNPKTLEYIESVVGRVANEWNYKFLKLDGLWVGGALEQLYVNDEYVPDDMGSQIFADPSRTNVENYRLGMELVRKTANDAFILGCNVSQNMRVLASSYGLVDAMRVGPDNGASWNGVCAGPWRGTNRYFYNGRVWFNDPDPVYARTSIPVERAQVSATWASITGQLYALSDWIPDYDAERTELVRKTIPNHRCKNVRPVDLFDVDLARVWLLTDERSGVRRDVVALFNWNGGDGELFELAPEKLGLPLVDENGEKIEKYVAYDFWNNEFVEPFEVLKTTLNKESCKVLAIRPVGKRPVLLSSSRHITQGVLEVERETWSESDKTLTIKTTVPSQMEYELRVYNPTTGRLDRWTAPSEKVGATAVEYRLGENGEWEFVAL